MWKSGILRTYINLIHWIEDNFLNPIYRNWRNFVNASSEWLRSPQETSSPLRFLVRHRSKFVFIQHCMCLVSPTKTVVLSICLFYLFISLIPPLAFSAWTKQGIYCFRFLFWISLTIFTLHHPKGYKKFVSKWRKRLLQ